MGTCFFSVFKWNELKQQTEMGRDSTLHQAPGLVRDNMLF